MRTRHIPFGLEGTKDFLRHPYLRVREIYRADQEIAPVKPRLTLTDDPDYYVELRLKRRQALRVTLRLVTLASYSALQPALLVFGIVLKHRAFMPPTSSMMLSIRVQPRKAMADDVAREPRWFSARERRAVH